MMGASKMQCRVCQKEDGDDIKLLRCNACKNIKDTWYCSKKCQKADWKEHKKHCLSRATAAINVNMAPGPSADSTSSIPDHEWKNGRGLQLKVDKPFTRLQDKKWLHDRPKA